MMTAKVLYEIKEFTYFQREDIPNTLSIIETIEMPEGKGILVKARIPRLLPGISYSIVSVEDDKLNIEILNIENPELLKITAAQGRVQLIRENKKDAIDLYISTSNNPELQELWEYSTFWHRYSPVIEQLAQHFNINLDDFWNKAKLIEL